MSPSSSQRNILAFLPQYSGEMYRHTMPFQGSGHMEDDLNRRLFSADERAYLLEEIEKKDNMLSMLTEGLREVSRLSVLSSSLLCLISPLYGMLCIPTCRLTQLPLYLLLLG